MAQYNTLNVKLSYSQLDQLKYGIKNGTEGSSEISLNIVGEPDDEKNFPHKLLLTNTQF